MPQPKRSTAPKRKAPAKRSAPRAGKDPLDRLKGSLDGAEAALKDLRTGASKGTGELVRDLEKTLKHLRSNARQVGREVSKDLAAAGREATKSSPRKPAARRTAKRPATTTRRKASAGRSK